MLFLCRLGFFHCVLGQSGYLQWLSLSNIKNCLMIWNSVTNKPSTTTTTKKSISGQIVFPSTVCFIYEIDRLKKIIRSWSKIEFVTKFTQKAHRGCAQENVLKRRIVYVYTCVYAHVLPWAGRHLLHSTVMAPRGTQAQLLISRPFLQHWWPAQSHTYTCVPMHTHAREHRHIHILFQQIWPLQVSLSMSLSLSVFPQLTHHMCSYQIRDLT